MSGAHLTVLWEVNFRARTVMAHPVVGRFRMYDHTVAISEGISL
jgi:hypothetical protein